MYCSSLVATLTLSSRNISQPSNRAIFSEHQRRESADFKTYQREKYEYNIIILWWMRNMASFCHQLITCLCEGLGQCQHSVISWLPVHVKEKDNVVILTSADSRSSHKWRMMISSIYHQLHQLITCLSNGCEENDVILLSAHHLSMWRMRTMSSSWQP